MSFEPNKDHHAIVEVVFGIRLARNVSAKEIEALIEAHPKFKEDFPRLNRTQIIQFAIGDGPPPKNMPQPTAGVSFDAMKRDGTLDWRLRIDDNMIFVNCLSYTRWSEIWEKVRQYFTVAGEFAVGSDNSVVGFVLQYIDVFRWTSEIDTYSIGEFLDRESKHLPASIFECGPLWHLHQGWYRPSEPPLDGRLLERIHLDAVFEDKQVPIVKADTFLQLELLKSHTWASIFHDDDSFGTVAYRMLHEVNKEMLRSILTQEMSEKVGLNG